MLVDLYHYATGNVLGLLWGLGFFGCWFWLYVEMLKP